MLWIFENIMEVVADSSLLNVSEDLKVRSVLYIHVCQPADTVHIVKFTILTAFLSSQSSPVWQV